MTSSLIARACRVLDQGKAVGVPTDTVYGLAAHRWAQRELFRLKGRPDDKPIPVLVGSVADAQRLAVFTPLARRLARQHWPGPVTLVLEAQAEASQPGAETIGIRMPDQPLALDLLQRCGPLAVTSANLSDQAPAGSDLQAREIFEAGVEIYLPGVCPGGVASTVIESLPGRKPRVLRAGPVSLEDRRRL